MVPCITSYPTANALNSYALHQVQASANASSFLSSWTWGAVAGFVAVLVTAAIAIVYRRRDTEAKRLKPGYDALGETLVSLDTLAAQSVVKSDLDKLHEQISKIKQAEQRSPKMPFGVVVARLKAYEDSVLPDEYAKRLVKDKSLLEEYLGLSREQGLRLEATRAEIAVVQRAVEKRIR
ncbi:hypothetical protein HRW23_34970 [Streptomyces lunaelactis]|uniref:hypothetical protein n=1 Tax=Streptomyces lunaelactis TaxID=1535768 RepID=UPI0015856B1F|nr:hypothetical protein [Streptomyces lunaelactis]NUK12612.1 hypothetical protein [Streptomyces lunaelactis]NUK38913.1 hypothetical protein [Streptomyces lunaelactis]NUK46017.1 hypothetical protein [Streptomyces lunaelactis]NUK61981.1 hypothetical protein [Streptomyces lunaelactis]NUK71015.1 hypothetical protein [Streptomyces lunaelactis]